MQFSLSVGGATIRDFPLIMTRGSITSTNLRNTLKKREAQTLLLVQMWSPGHQSSRGYLTYFFCELHPWTNLKVPGGLRRIRIKIHPIVPDHLVGVQAKTSKKAPGALMATSFISVRAIPFEKLGGGMSASLKKFHGWVVWTTFRFRGWVV